MICRIQRQAAFLILGLAYAICAVAAEHPAPVAPAAADKSAATAAKAKPTAVESAKTTVTDSAKAGAAETAAPVEAGIKKIVPVPVAARPAAPPVAGTRPAIVPPPPRNVHPKPRKAAPAHALHWSYEGESGPHGWAKLSPEYAKCGSGQRQSPIDIRDGMKVDLEPIKFEYRSSIFKVVDNGHAIQASDTGRNFMSVMGRRFRLIQLHFHRPSEEAIDGKHFEMVVHMVHMDGDGRIAVVAVLVDNGARQPVIQTVLNNLPLEKGDAFAAATTLDANQILPENRRYFTYMGSLTTPPCTEDVLWLVMKEPVQASVDQLNLFQRIYPMNVRPIQGSMGRIIKESN
jgi:carbonic anhydrase